MPISITERDLHSHIRARMRQRGVTFEEIIQTLEKGWPASKAKPGTFGKTFVFPYQREWEGRYFEEKEVTVYYKMVMGKLVLLTVIARYGSGFPKRDQEG